MKKLALGMMVALIAVSLASPAFADNDKGERGEKNGQFQKISKWLKKAAKDDDRDENRDNKNRTDVCAKDARTAYGKALKSAFETMQSSRKAAHDVRVAAVIAANGNQTAIDAAWSTYQASWLTAWKTYSNAVFAAMGTFGTVRSACPRVTPKPSATVSPTPTPSVSATPTPTPTPAPVGYNMTQIATHNTAANCWTTINGKVYNLSGSLNHPGGQTAITALCGANGSAFIAKHGSAMGPNNMLNGFQIGVLVQ